MDQSTAPAIPSEPGSGPAPAPVAKSLSSVTFTPDDSQEYVLEKLRASGARVSVFLLNRIRLEGTISGSDQYSILLTGPGGEQQLISKTRISTIALSGDRDDSHERHDHGADRRHRKEKKGA